MEQLYAWTAIRSAGATAEWVEAHLSASRESINSLLAVGEARRTVENTLLPFDRAQMHLRIASSQAGVMFMVHPSAHVRDEAQAAAQTISAEYASLSLNRQVYEALAAIDGSTEDDATRYYLQRTLLGYRLSGVDRDDETREKIRGLADRMSELSMSFSRTVQDDVRHVTVPAETLRGLPADYLERHGVQVASDAPVVLSTDPPDMAPVMSYAVDRALRRNMYLAYNNRGYPANKQVLLDLLAARQEMAGLLGFRSWVELATADQMMGSLDGLQVFLSRVEDAARQFAQEEFAQLEQFVQSCDPDALPLTLSDARFWEEQFRRRYYDFDSQSVRPYFPYVQVEAGVLSIAARLFGVRFEHVVDALVWAAGVKAFDVFDGSSTAAPTQSRMGRIYLDMHPREGKSKWFSECSLVPGVLGLQVPEAALVCNFPEPGKHDPGLLQYSDVVTFFHEFGHLMHEILGGQQRWSGQSGIATEGDFVEVPSQMLEEFFESPDLLRSFAKHYQTGEPIPYDVVARMTQAAAHGRALSTLTQVMYARYSMETHDRRAQDLDLDLLLREGYDRFSQYEFVEDNRMYAAFTHLLGYTSNYYTYLYDKVMALEFFAEFAKPDGEQLFDEKTALRYRQQVLEPGGSKPASALVHDFLGRAVSMEAIGQWVGRGRIGADDGAELATSVSVLG